MGALSENLFHFPLESTDKKSMKTLIERREIFMRNERKSFVKISYERRVSLVVIVSRLDCVKYALGRCSCESILLSEGL